MTMTRTYAWIGSVLAVGAICMGWILLTQPSETKETVLPVPVEQVPEDLVAEVQSRLEVNTLRDPATRPEAAWTVVPLDGAIAEQPFSVTSADLEFTETPVGYRLTMEGQASRMGAGSPDVPRLTKLIDGVPGMIAQAEVLSSSYREIANVDLQPVEESYRYFGLDGTTEIRVRQEADEDIYGTDGFWPKDIVSVTEAWMGTQKVARIEVQPVQYNPVTRTLRYHESVSARIRYEHKPDSESLSVSLASGPVEVRDPFGCPTLYPDPILPPMNGQASDFAVRRSGLPEGVDALYKIRLTTGGGLYLLTQAELTAGGVPAADLIGTQLRLFNQDREMSLRVSKTGLFTGAGDYIMFNASSAVRTHTTESVIWLGIGGTGLRMVEEASPPVGGAAEVTSHFRTLLQAPNTLYTDNRAPLNEEWDHWYVTDLLTYFDQVDQVPVPAFSYSYNAAVDYPAPGGTAKVCATLHGLSQNSSFGGDGHNTVIRLNGSQVASLRWSGTASFGGAPHSGSATFSSSLLTSPTTTLDLRQELLSGNNGADQVSLEAVTLIYPRQLRTVSDRFAFLGEAGLRNYTVDGFSSASGLWVFDTSDPDRPKRITGFSTQSTANGFNVRFGRDASGVEIYRIVRSTEFKTVTSIEKTMIRGLGNPEQQADYIVICPYEFRDQAYTLMTNRHLKGQTVVVAPIEDIFNEFGYGYRDATAVRQFLGYAFHHWQSPPPRAVVILGDASEDPLGYSPASVSPDNVPTILGGTSFNYTGLDVRNVLVNGTTTQGEADNLADMALGRITAQTASELQAVVDKIIAYEAVPFTDPFRKRALLVAGKEKSAPLGFAATADGIYASMTDTNAAFTSVNKQYHGQGGSLAGVLGAINDAQGRYAAAYFGHGSHFVWNNSETIYNPPDDPVTIPSYLSTTNLGDLVNGRLPIVTATTCINGMYTLAEPGEESLAEGLLERPSHGAVAVIAGTALSQDQAASSIAVHFYDALVQDKVHTLGEAMMAGYLGAFGAGFKTAHELVFYQIFGDPGLIVNPAP